MHLFKICVISLYMFAYCIYFVSLYDSNIIASFAVHDPWAPKALKDVFLSPTQRPSLSLQRTVSISEGEMP